jgi:putative MATE family efflux protein
MRSRAHDREILRLALPALGALAAEPLYILVDTAIVGHLGTRELAALALAATVLTAVVTLCNFLAYSTTAQVARLHGAGREQRAAQIAAQALWLSLAIGVALAALVAALAHPLMLVIGGTGEAAELAERYLRISAAGLPFALIALAGQGYLRGVDRLRAPLVILVVANLVNVVLELVLVYGLDLGLDGSAAGTVVAQAGMGAAFVVLLLRAGRPGVARRPRWADQRSLLRMGGDLVVRTGSLLAAFVLAGAVLARTSTAALAAHQVAFQLFVFLSLVLDSIAIAGQVIVGRALGAGDADGAQAAARRMIMWSIVVGCIFAASLLAGTALLPRVFTDDAAVLAQARDLWPLFALLQPAGAVVFALDGILIGAGDTRYIAKAMAFSSLVCFTPVVLASLAWDWGVVGVWAALNVLMLARLATMAVRFRGRRWAVVGAVA